MPHVEVLPYTLSDGKEVIVEGVVPPSANRFNISFCKERDSNKVTPFTFDARFNDNVIVRNHNNNGWGPEERQGGNPFKKGEHYKIRFALKGSEFQVFVNDQHFCDFKQRIANEEAKHVVVDGDFTVHKVNFSGSGGQGEASGVHNNPPVPFNLPIRIKSGSKVIIQGMPAGTNRFSIFFATGPSHEQNDIAFVFDVRFNCGNDKHKIIRNHKSAGKWGTEERKDEFPFTGGNICEIVVKIKEDAFKVTINDDKYCTHFCHIKPEQVTHLMVTGDIKLNKVEIQH